jgi:hypothetical protein
MEGVKQINSQRAKKGKSQLASEGETELALCRARFLM